MLAIIISFHLICSDHVIQFDDSSRIDDSIQRVDSIQFNATWRNAESLFFALTPQSSRASSQGFSFCIELKGYVQLNRIRSSC